MSNSGAAVAVTLVDGSILHGWVYRDGAAGLFISLDREGKEIRYLPRGTWRACAFDHENRAAFRNGLKEESDRSQAWKAERGLAERIAAGLNRTDFNRTRRILLSFEDAIAKFYMVEQFREYEIVPVELAMQVRATYAELLDELEQSGLANVVMERSEEIQIILEGRGLPYFDYRWARDWFSYGDGELMLDDLVLFAARENLVREFKLGRTLLDQVSVTQVARDPDLSPNVVPTTAEPQKTVGPSPLSIRLKKIAAFSKMAVGGGLAAANVCAGVSVGIVTALPTLGAGAIAGAVGIGTSVYTGLNSACDALKDLSEALK